MISIIVVGVGLIGPRHAEQIQLNPETKLIAFVDPSPGAVKVGKRFNVPVFKSLKDLINEGLKPDAAYVCTPNTLHVPVAMELAENGIHLLVEKPISTSIVDAIKLRDYTKKNGIKLLLGHHRRFNPYTIAAKAHLKRLGRISAINGFWTLKKTEEYFKTEVWRNSKKSGGGPLAINLVHDVDLLQYLIGPIDSIYAEELRKLRSPQSNIESNDHVEEGAVIVISFKNGVKGTFILSDNVISPFNYEMGTGENPLIPKVNETSDFYTILGSNGTITVPGLKLFHQDNLLKKGWWEPLQIENLSKNEDLSGIPFQLQLKHFIKYLKGEEEAKCTADDAISAIIVVQAVRKSLETGLPVKVNDILQGIIAQERAYKL